MTTIREALPADRPATIGLWESCGLTRPWNDPGLDFDRAVAGPTSAVLVAVDEDGVVEGSAMVGADGHRGWAYYLAVRPDRRGRGLGRTVMAAAEAWLRDAGMPKLELMVRADNAEAHRFYDALGYESSDVVVRQTWLA